VPEAIKTEASTAIVPVKQQIAVDFAREIAPLVAAKCSSCHSASGPAPRLDAEERTKAGSVSEANVERLYKAVLGVRGPASSRTGLSQYVHPGRARTSPLVWHLFGHNTAKPWDGAASQHPVKPIPEGKNSPLTPAEIQTIVRWIDLGAPRKPLTELSANGD
jgi:hypothetical protein